MNVRQRLKAPRKLSACIASCLLLSGSIAFTIALGFVPAHRGAARPHYTRRCSGRALAEGEEFLDEGEGERIYTDVNPADVQEEEYAFDDSVFAEDKPEDIGPVHYYGVTDADGVAIVPRPAVDLDAFTESDRLFPGDVVAAQVPTNGSAARLLDGRGWLELSQLGNGLEEVQPWAARIMKKPGIAKADAESLGYLSLDDSKLTPLAQHLPLPNRVLAQLDKRGVKRASPIQEAVFSDIYRGKSLCLQSQTGTGKTLAMVLPLLTAMSEESQWGSEGDKIVVITSCRELAVQLFSDIDSMGFFPAGKGYATMVIVGNVPPSEAVLNANVIIGTPNELGGLLHKDNQIVQQMTTKLRGILLDEVDEYTTAPRLFASKWAIKKKRRIYNEKKAVLSGRLGDFNTGVIEWFLKRSLAYSRRRDLQVLAASATMNRAMARKVHRLLRWDPLGRWYQEPPPLMRPTAMMKADWQAVPFMPTVPLDIQHRFVPVVEGKSTTHIDMKHWTRKPFAKGGLPRLKIRGIRQQRGWGQRPVAVEKAQAMLDGLHDALRSRPKGSGSALVMICRSVGLTVRNALQNLHRWGFHEAEAMHEALWTDPTDWPSKWAIKYSYNQKDNAVQIAQRHQELNQRTKNAQHLPFPVGGSAWKAMEARKKKGQCTAPVLVCFEGLGRGIHFDGVDTVYILGLPQRPKAYLHYAGRVGRLGQKAGKVVSILPMGGEKVLRAWESKIGPGVRFEEEPVQRIRSKQVFKKSSYSLPLETQRSLQRHREELKEAEKEPLLLPEPVDPFKLPGMEEDEEPEPEPVQIPEKMREAMRNRGSRSDQTVKRIAQEMQRATSRWPGPRKVSRYVPRLERWKQEKAEKAKAKAKSK
ncbi:unnamed protein product [Durusdinium trenchii]|uniref:RNA helicase n=1 Tax=Durusdinium trenchii TaxID=1381693 RepID=A0ABP0J585_9DINO